MDSRKWLNVFDIMRPIAINYTAPHIQKHNFNINYPRDKKPPLNRKETARRKTKNLPLRFQNGFLNHPSLLDHRQSPVSQTYRFAIAVFPFAMGWPISFLKMRRVLGSMELVVVVPAFGTIAAEVEQLFFRLRIHMAVRKQHIRPPVVPKTRAVPKKIVPI